MAAITSHSHLPSTSIRKCHLREMCDCWGNDIERGSVFVAVQVSSIIYIYREREAVKHYIYIYEVGCRPLFKLYVF